MTRALARRRRRPRGRRTDRGRSHRSVNHPSSHRRHGAVVIWAIARIVVVTVGVFRVSFERVRRAVPSNEAWWGCLACVCLVPWVWLAADRRWVIGRSSGRCARARCRTPPQAKDGSGGARGGGGERRHVGGAMDDDVKGCKDDDDDDDGAMVGTPRDDYDMDAKVRQQHHLQHRIRRYFHRRPSRCRPRTSFVTIRIICDDLRIARARERKRRQRAVRVFARALAPRPSLCYFYKPSRTLEEASGCLVSPHIFSSVPANLESDPLVRGVARTPVFLSFLFYLSALTGDQ